MSLVDDEEVVSYHYVITMQLWIYWGIVDNAVSVEIKNIIFFIALLSPWAKNVFLTIESFQKPKS